MTNTYDRTHYESYAYPQTHPEHLYTLAQLFSVNAPDFNQARILELGCASGGNLIPMAYHLPKSEFLGIDLSHNQIEVGQGVIQELGLKNIQLKHQSILDFDKDSGKFDYIICHGLYSWVDQAVRDKIFAIFKEHLSEQGVAYISYNTLPGWSMVRSIRDMMIYHTENIEDPKQKAQQARALLHFISEGLEGDDSSYAQFLNMEINLLKNQPDSYLLHDHLEEVNQPVYFYELAEHAAQFNLSYLSDAYLVSMFVGNLPPHFAQEISKVKSIIIASQYMDFIRNQRFRATLFCHDKTPIQRNLDVASLEKFYFSYGGKRDQSLDLKNYEEGKTMQFMSPSITLSTSNQAAKIAMRCLIESPKPVSYSELVDKIATTLSITNKAMIKKLINQELNLLRLVLGGLINIHSSPGNHVVQTNSKPKTTDLILNQSKRKNYVINMRHEVVVLNPFERLFLQQLNGQHGQTEIVASLVKKVKEGTFQVFDENKQPVTDETLLAKEFNKVYQPTLNKFIQCALMIH